jgi:thiol-disulfide isomerase/thioredoxin
MTTRRPILLGSAVAAAAAAAGGGLWLWRASRSEPVGDELWSLRLERPGGGLLEVSTLRGQPLLLNFWATWCPPCIREMPVLDRFARDHAERGWRVLGIAADNAAPVREYLSRAPVSYPTALAGFAGVDLSRRLGNLSGALPFSCVIDRRGTIVQRHMGELRSEQLEAWGHAFS